MHIEECIKHMFLLKNSKMSSSPRLRIRRLCSPGRKQSESSLLLPPKHLPCPTRSNHCLTLGACLSQLLYGSCTKYLEGMFWGLSCFLFLYLNPSLPTSRPWVSETEHFWGLKQQYERKKTSNVSTSLWSKWSQTQLRLWDGSCWCSDLRLKARCGSCGDLGDDGFQRPQNTLLQSGWSLLYCCHSCHPRISVHLPYLSSLLDSCFWRPRHPSLLSHFNRGHFLVLPCGRAHGRSIVWDFLCLKNSFSCAYNWLIIPAGYQILGWKLFYLRFLTVCLIASSITREKSKVISDS